jgi:uncharacterized protein
MPEIPRKLTNFNLFVEKKGFAGLVTEVSLPKITHKMMDHRGGGMIGTIRYQMGIEPMEATFKLASYEPGPFKLMGFRRGGPLSLQLIGTQQYYGDVLSMEAIIRGMISEMDPGTIKIGDDTSLSFKMDVEYYKLSFQDKDTRVVTDVVEIDIKNNVEKYGDDDLQASIRRILRI